MPETNVQDREDGPWCRQKQTLKVKLDLCSITIAGLKP